MHSLLWLLLCLPEAQAAQPALPRFATVGKPARLQAGGPLAARISATRSGRVLTLTYLLTEADGRRFFARGTPPQFTVSQDGRQVGSGSFEYG